MEQSEEESEYSEIDEDQSPEEEVTFEEEEEEEEDNELEEEDDEEDDSTPRVVDSKQYLYQLKGHKNIFRNS